MEAAPVTAPASIIMAPSKTICWPAKGVIFKSVPAVEDIVLPSIFILSTCNAVSVPAAAVIAPTTKSAGVPPVITSAVLVTLCNKVNLDTL